MPKDASAPSFDVVTIRTMEPGDARETHIANSLRNGYFQATNVNLKSLMEFAFDIPDLRIHGGPKWVDTQKYYVEAKASPDLDQAIGSRTPDEAKKLKRRMVEALLITRFGLVTHKEARDMPILALRVAKGGTKLGQVLSPVDGSKGGEQIYVKAGGDSLLILAYELSWRLGRPVIDQTGLQYREKIDLRWNEEQQSSDEETISLASALQEQLGLRLEPGRGTVPVLVVDRVSEPTGN